MAPTLKPAGQNGKTTSQALIDAVLLQITASPLADSIPAALAMLPILVRTGQTERAEKFLSSTLSSTTGAAPAVLWSALAEQRVSATPEAAAAHLKHAINHANSSAPPSVQVPMWSAISRAQRRLGQDHHAALSAARSSAAQHPDRAAAGAILVRDLLAVGDLEAAAAVCRRLIAPRTDVALFTRLCAHFYAADRLEEAIDLVLESGDLLDHTTILRAALAEPVAARDVEACSLLITRCPAAYRTDLLEETALAWVEQGKLGAVRRLLVVWQTLQPRSVLRLGLQAMLGDADATAALKAELSDRLAVEEVAWHDTWRYRELGRACGWAGDLSGTLSALERIVDHEDRMSALLSAARHAPLLAREPLLCAARGLAASMQDERHRAEAIAHLGALQLALGQRRAGLARLEEASRLAVSIRRPRSDQGLTRRAALEAVIADQLAAGDNIGAFRTARKLRTRHMRNPHLTTIAVRYARQGDLGGAACCLESMTPGVAQAEAGAAALTAWLDAGCPVRSTEAA